MKAFAQKLEDLVSIGWKVDSADDYGAWIDRVSSLLSAATDSETAAAFLALGGDDPDAEWDYYLARQTGHLEGLALRTEASGAQVTEAERRRALPTGPTAVASRRVFIVHGHDSATKEATARFVERLGLEPIILHEQANGGRTIIEKFEVHADVGFAIVLMTPDDVGAGVNEKKKLAPRARQNVILELGFFTGRLGRSRVCALFIPGIEIPSDIHGVLFVEFDEHGAWRSKLANELVSAGIKINIQALLQG